MEVEAEKSARVRDLLLRDDPAEWRIKIAIEIPVPRGTFL